MQQIKGQAAILPNSQEVSLREYKPQYSQVVYQGQQVVQPQEFNQGVQNQELGQKNNQGPLIEKEISFRNQFSRFAVTNVVFGVYYLIILLFRGILLGLKDDIWGIFMLIFIYTTWGISFYLALKTFKSQKPSQLYTFQIIIIVLGIVEAYVQSQVYFALDDSSFFFQICFFAFWIGSTAMLILLFTKCKQLRTLTIEIQYLKLEQQQQSEASNI